jgi:hypothetical protein
MRSPGGLKFRAAPPFLQTGGLRMHRSLLATAVAFGLMAAGSVGTARADVDGEGNILPTGNAGVDAGIAMANAWNRIVRDTQDAAQVLRQRDRLLDKLDDQRKLVPEMNAKLKEGWSRLDNEQHALAKARERRLAECRGDAQKERSVEDEFAARGKQIAAAKKDLEAAQADLGGMDAYLGEMHKTLSQVGQRGDAQQALEDWRGGRRADGSRNDGLQLIFYRQRAKLEAKLADFRKRYASAAATLGTMAAAPDTRKEAVGDFVVRVKSMSGTKMQLSVNGRPVKVGSEMGVGKDRTLALVASLVDARRKQSREIASKPPVHVTVEKASDWELIYSIPGKRSAWKVTQETYEWREPSTRTGAPLQVAHRSSPVGGVKNDVLEVTFIESTAVDEISVYVRGAITWSNGDTENDDSEGTSIVLGIVPAR